MLVIWYTLYINHDNLQKVFPSSNLDHVFDEWQHSETESNPGSNSESESGSESGEDSSLENSNSTNSSDLSGDS